MLLCIVRLFGGNLVIQFQDTRQWFDIRSNCIGRLIYLWLFIISSNCMQQKVLEAQHCVKDSILVGHILFIFYGCLPHDNSWLIEVVLARYCSCALELWSCSCLCYVYLLDINYFRISFNSIVSIIAFSNVSWTFFWATRFLFLCFSYFLFLGRALDSAGHLISFWAHVNLPHCIVSLLF